MSRRGPEDRELRAEVDRRQWYHTLELAPGIVTPGWLDLRQIVDRVPIPAELTGLRCLDVGTFDGFWAFEMERRGADEVVAIDVLDPRSWDWPAGAQKATIEEVGRRKGRGEGFLIAARAVGSSVRRLERSLYDLDPSEVGRFDLVYVGSLLLHLRDPVGALQRARRVCRGRLILCDAVDLFSSLASRRRPVARLDAEGRPWWWKPNAAALARMAEAAGFDVVAAPKLLLMPPGPGQRRIRPAPRLLRTIAGREALLRTWWGDPHATLLAV